MSRISLKKAGLQPFIMMFCGIAVLAIYDASTIIIDDRVSIEVIIFYRALAVAVIVTLIELFRYNGIVGFATHYSVARIPIWHVAQGVFFTGSAVFYVIAFRGEGMVYTYLLSFLHPAWAILIRVFFLRKDLPCKQVMGGVLVAFIGVALAVFSEPEMSKDHVLAGLLAGLFFGGELTLAEHANERHGTSGYDTLFYASIIFLMLSSIPMALYGHGLDFSQQNLGIAGTGVVSTVATLLVFLAIKSGESCVPKVGADRLTPIDYTILVFGAICDVLTCGALGSQSACKRVLAMNWPLLALACSILGVGIVVIMTFSGRCAEKTDDPTGSDLASG